MSFLPSSVVEISADTDIGPGFRLMSPANRFTKMSSGRRPRGSLRKGVLECLSPLPGYGFVAHENDTIYAFENVTWLGISYSWLWALFDNKHTYGDGSNEVSKKGTILPYLLLDGFGALILSWYTRSPKRYKTMRNSGCRVGSVLRLREVPIKNNMSVGIRLDHKD